MKKVDKAKLLAGYLFCVLAFAGCVNSGTGMYADSDVDTDLLGRRSMMVEPPTVLLECTSRLRSVQHLDDPNSLIVTCMRISDQAPQKVHLVLSSVIRGELVYWATPAAIRVGDEPRAINISREISFKINYFINTMCGVGSTKSVRMALYESRVSEPDDVDDYGKQVSNSIVVLFKSSRIF